MTMRLAASLTLLFGLVSVLACGGDPTRELPRYDDAHPLPLESALLYLDHTDEDAPNALVVDVSHARPRLRSHALPPGRGSGQGRPGSAGREVVVLTAGRDARIEDGAARDAVSSYVVLFDREGERWRKELPGRFEELAIAADGDFAVAHRPAAGVALADTVALVDLRDEGTSPRNVRLSDAAGQPMRSFVFSDAAASGRRLLLARGANRLQLVDLERPADTAKSVDLKLPGDARELAVGRVIFRESEVYVQVLGSSDVLLLQLIAEDDGSFHVAPLQLATGSQVRDIALIEEGGAAQLVALGDGMITLLEPVTGSGVSSTLSSGFSQILPFRASSPLDDQERARALLIERNGSRIAFVDFDDGTAWAQQSVEVLTLDDSVTDFVPVAEHKLAVLVYATGGLALVDLEQRTVSPIETNAMVAGSLLDVDGGAARLWLRLDDGRIGHLDLLALEASEVLLNAPAANLLVVEGDRRCIAAIHDASSGYVTLLDPELPSRESARELAGFLYSQIFD